MYQNEAHSFRGPIQAGLVTVLIIVAAIYITTTVGSRDPLWFWAEFDEQPTALIARCDGREVALAPGDAAFAEFVAEFNRLLSANKRWDELALSEITENEYRTNSAWMVVEMIYSPPIRIHSQYPFFNTTEKLIVPLVGRHADSAPVFGKVGDLPESGAFHLSTNETLFRILTDGGVCAVKPS
jgi:hypothetical protein